MSNTAAKVSALVVVTLFMIVSLLSLGAAPHAANPEVAAITATQSNG